MTTRFLDPLDVRDLGDGENWMLLHEMRYVTAEGEMIYVPAGFVTDFASVPWFFRRLFPPATGKYRRAAALHDWIYREKTVMISREKGDLIFLEAMTVDGTNYAARTSLYQAVDKFGGSSYVDRIAA